MTFEEFWKTNGVTSTQYPLVAETYKELAQKAWDVAFNQGYNQGYQYGYVDAEAECRTDRGYLNP